MSNSVPSVFTAPNPTKEDLQTLQVELDGNIYRNVPGFYAKFFKGKPWSSFITDRLRGRNADKVINKLSGDLPGIAHFHALADWLADLQALFFRADQDNFRWHSQQLPPKGGTARTRISLETFESPSVAGSTRMFGEFYHTGGIADDEDVILCFCARARQIFSAQSARLFLHGLIVRATTLELWVFDRSGAYSSGKFDLATEPELLARVLAGYTLMSDANVGLNTFVKRLANGSDSHVTIDHNRLDLRSELIATADYIVGPGTTCYVASESRRGTSGIVIKFSWRDNEHFTEARLLRKALDRKAGGAIKLIDHQDLTSIADLRRGLDFPQGFENQIFSCMATTPLGRPIRSFSSITELLEVLHDLVKALESLHLKAGILHRDIAIKNLIITPQNSEKDPKGVLIDFNLGLDLDNIRPFEPLVGSDGFMAIGILFGEQHTYRHDLESLFYVFIWLAISNDRLNDDANDIVQGLPATSRLHDWCSMDFAAVGEAKLADMSPKGFERLLEEFDPAFAHLRYLARDLHSLLFPIREREVYFGTDTGPLAARKLYDEMAECFGKSARALQAH